MTNGTLRASIVLVVFFLFTLPLMPVQAVLKRTSIRYARHFPHWYHRQVCRILGIMLDMEGAVARDVPVLLVSNHTSWLDITVLSAVAPVSFIAKHEVAAWPFVSWLATLQRSVFVDRTKRHETGTVASEIMQRLELGDTIVLFAEATTGDGNRLLPFKTSLFGAVMTGTSPPPAGVIVQTIAVVYTHLRGVPISRAYRPRVGWYGDMEMTSHAWQVLKGGPITATIRISPPVALNTFKDRKDLAMQTEKAIRRAVHSILRGRPDDGTLSPVEPSADVRRGKAIPAATRSEKWT